MADSLNHRRVDRPVPGFDPTVGSSDQLLRGRRSIALNLKSKRVHEIIMQMAKRADVVVQNFRPGVLARLGRRAEPGFPCDLFIVTEAGQRAVHVSPPFQKASAA